MANIMAKNKRHAIIKTKTFIRNVIKEDPKKFNIKVLGKPNPKFNYGKYKMYNVSIQKKNKR